MKFGDVLKKTWRENILFSALVELTYRCNLDCYYCYNDVASRGSPLTTEEYFRFFEDLRDMQTMNLVLSGGEPLAHPDFLALGRRARDLGFVIRIKSNGHAIGEEMAGRIRSEIAPFIVEVSLHGSRPATHDRQTRVRGSFDRLMSNVRGMLDAGLRVKLNSTLTVWNETEVEEMFAIADRLGVRLQVGLDVSPRDNGDGGVLAISASNEGRRRLLRLIRARAEAARRSGGNGAEPAREGGPDVEELMPPSPDKHCGAGSSGVTVDPYGNVYPCVQWRRAAGNLHEMSIQEIWSTSSILRDVRSLTVQAKNLVDGYGSRGQLLHFCPGLALVKTGSPIRMYPRAEENMRIADEVESERLIAELPVLP